MSEVFIDWSKAPEGTTHAYVAKGAVWTNGEPEISEYWENHTATSMFEYVGGEWVHGGDVVHIIAECDRIARPKFTDGAPESTIHDPNVPGYEKLRDVLERAYNQAAKGKGAERHGKNLPFHLQPMQQIADMYGIGFMLGQVAKKIEEAQRLPKDRAIAELLGAINYCAGAVIFLEKQGQ